MKRKKIEFRILTLFLTIILFACKSEPQEILLPGKTAGKEVIKGAISIDYQGHIYMRAKVDGQEGDFLFDTGADQIYIDSVFYSANEMKHGRLAMASVPGAGVGVQRVPVILDTVKAVFGDETFARNIVPLIHLKQILGDKADGIIGSGWCRDRILRVNYGEEYMCILDRITPEIQQSYTAVPFEWKNQRIRVPVEIVLPDGTSYQVRSYLDLGSGSALVLTSSFAESVNVESHVKKKVKRMTKQGGIGGSSVSYEFRAQSLTLAGFQMQQPVLNYSVDQQGALATDRHDGLLGNEVMERFDLIIDFPGRQLLLKPNDHIYKEFKSSLYGLTLTNRAETLGCWVVNAIYEGSPADKAGISGGDKVTMVNSVSVKEVSDEQRIELLQNPESLTLILETPTGSKAHKLLPEVLL